MIDRILKWMINTKNLKAYVEGEREREARVRERERREREEREGRERGQKEESEKYTLVKVILSARITRYCML